MSNLLHNILKKTTWILGISGIITQAAIAAPEQETTNFETISPTEALGVIRNRPELQTPLNRSQTQQFNDSAASQPMSQVTSVSELKDVSPTDWAYEALRSLVERYGCIVGYPDRTFRGNRAASRWEFAAGLNACLNTIERLLQENVAVLREDIEKLKRLAQEFEQELVALGSRVSNIESRVAFLEDHQFATTTKLNGEAIFTVSDAWGERALDFREQDLLNQGLLERRRIDDKGVLGYRVRYNFDTSFTGEDLLKTRFESGSIVDWSDPTGTNMARLGHDSQLNGNAIIDDMYYRFPVGNLTAWVGGNSLDIDDIFDVGNPFLFAEESGALSRFIRYNPLTFRGSEGKGIGLSYKFSDAFILRGLYLTNNGNNPDLNNGLFNGNYSTGAQLGVYPSDALSFTLTFLHTYFKNAESDISSSTGSYVEPNNQTSQTGTGIARDPFLGAPTIRDSYGITGNWRISPSFNLSAWGGYALARAQGSDADGNSRKGFGADIWAWSAALSVIDIGKEGAVFSVAGGQTSNARRIDALTGDLTIPDQDTPYIVETQYKYPISNNVLITPGVYVIINPDGNNQNNSIWVGAIRTTFTF
ncbi:iron uptake porin [Aphanothece sacrum]|uniref:S-layer OprB family carbohydrate-selective porin n=1 Tax=Aphanothece sacrum FPU1 TaxID=1920663 RepID=A0A401IML4_APHSA|nr:iron uptake porin [Aphanothece sacrum]GBF82510.1 S-layer OprB family carbohydrate-selective porin [Aphanothece sacrum FPU1]